MYATGLNVQAPWSNLLINGSKTVETRTYHLPLKYIGVPLALIETPGKSGRFKSRIIGLITFSESFRYYSEKEWIDDYSRHKVNTNSEYGWNDAKKKFGWVVDNVKGFIQPIDPPQRRGIIFTNECHIPLIISNYNDY